MQEKFVTREMHQSLMRSFRESSIARNFLRQSLSSSSQSEVQEISEISENFYSDQSHSSENLYNRQFSSSKKTFQSRFSKFYQSSHLSKQFYRSSLVSQKYSSLVSSRSLSHKYSSSISFRLFVSSSFTSVNQSIKSSEYDRELANLIKLYTNEAKYSEKNDNISFKFIMFNDMCDRIDVSFEAKLKALLTMLKRLALNCYYSNVINSKASLTFDDVCVSIMSYFEDAEYKRSILNK